MDKTIAGSYNLRICVLLKGCIHWHLSICNLTFYRHVGPECGVNFIEWLLVTEYHSHFKSVLDKVSAQSYLMVWILKSVVIKSFLWNNRCLNSIKFGMLF